MAMDSAKSDEHVVRSEVHRRTLPADRDDYRISLTTERQADGRWAVVVAVVHASETATKTIDLPVPQARFDSQAEAEAFGHRMGRDWLRTNP